MRKTLSLVPLLLATILLPKVPARNRPFGVKDFLRLPILASPAFSPDGKRAVFLEVRRDLEKDTYHRALHLVDPATGRDKPISADELDEVLQDPAVLAEVSPWLDAYPRHYFELELDSLQGEIGGDMMDEES